MKTSLTALTLIGKCGEDKSTVGSQLVGSEQFFESAETKFKSSTSIISGIDVPDASIKVYDMPGLDVTTGKPERLFQQLVNHLDEHGGVLALVQSQSTTVDPRVKYFLKELSIVLEHQPFSTYCVLITSKTKNDPAQTIKQHNKHLVKHQRKLQKEVLGRWDGFARTYPTTSPLISKEIQQPLIQNLKEDVPMISGLKPGMVVLTWNVILQLSENEILREDEKKALLTKEVARLESIVDAIQSHREPSRWRRIIGHVFGRKSHVRIRSKQLRAAKRALQTAQMNIQTLNMDALVAKAKRIRALVQKPPQVSLTLIGKSGEGKSTTANYIVGSYKTFTTSSGAKSCTEMIASSDVPGSRITIYDTPGIGDTHGRSEGFFQKITDHLYKHGGVIAFVQSQARVDDRIKNHLEALSLVLDGQPFSTCCVLITTKLNFDPFLTREQHKQELAAYQRDMEAECLPRAASHERGDWFARTYAYSTHLPDTVETFVSTIKQDVPRIRGIAPGMVLTWEQICQLTEIPLKDSNARKQLLLAEVQRQENNVEALEETLQWYVDTKNQVNSHNNDDVRKAFKRLQASFVRAKSNLEQAKKNLQTLNTSALEAKAKRIRRLIE